MHADSFGCVCPVGPTVLTFIHYRWNVMISHNYYYVMTFIMWQF